MKTNFIRAIALVAVALVALTSCGNNETSKTTTPATKENATVEAIMTRYSIRSYTDQQVAPEQLNTLMACAINAPSAMNKQPWEVRVVTNPHILTGISDVYKAQAEATGDANMLKAVQAEGFRNIFKGAPAVIFIAVKEGASYGEYGCGLLSENIMVAANSMGLGTCCLGGIIRFMNDTPEAAPYLADLGFSQGHKLLVAIAVGHPAEKPMAKPRDMKKVRFIK